MDEEEGEARRTSHSFLLNLPLIFAESESCGFTVMTHLEKTFLAMSLKWNKDHCRQEYPSM